MYSFNFRYQFHIYRRKISVFSFLIIFFSTTYLNAQLGTKDIHLPDYDFKKLHYGLQLGIFRSYINIKPTQAFSSQDTINIIGLSRPGFSIGFILNLSLPDHYWDLRILPNFSYYSREIAFQDLRTNEEIIKKNEIYFLEIPLLIKYKSRRWWNQRMYMVAGIVPSFRVSNKIEGDINENVPYSNANFELTYGFGFSSFQKYVNFAPEIRFSHGLSNILSTDISNEFTRQINKIKTFKIALYLNFEG